MNIRPHLSPSPRLTRSWHLALVIALLGSVILPQPALAASTWTNVTSLGTARSNSTATVLPNGKVLVVGGCNDSNCTSGVLASAEVFDPGANTWTTVASMHTTRYAHTATLLLNGKVLVAGGYNGDRMTSTELYDPNSGPLGTWTIVASMYTARDDHTATLLPNGKVLVAGGYGSNGGDTSVEVYDPNSGTLGTWTTVAPMNTGRAGHTATLLTSGEVLVTGGDNFGTFSTTSELYDPNSGTLGAWTPVASMHTGRLAHTATLLPNGLVLVAGGETTGSLPTNSAEVYDPNSGTFGAWTIVPSLNAARHSHTATLLPSGKVLVVGGWNGSSSLGSAEVYDPNSGTLGAWTIVASLNTTRCCHSAALLPSGKVLVAGGYNGSSSLASVEVYGEVNNYLYLPLILK